MATRQRARKPASRRQPVEAYLRRHRRRRGATLLVALLVLLALVLLDRTGPGLYVTDDLRRYHGKSFHVVRVIDGDTIDLRVPDGDKPTTRIRLWGVDTPELARQDTGKPAEPLAEEATDLTRQLVEGQHVTLLLEPHRLRGGYGRLLAYVQLPDGTLLNARLIEAGLSEHDDRWSHTRSTAFDLLEVEARARGVGRWAKD